MKGRKPQLVSDGKFASLPLHDEPQSVHFARAQALRPDGRLTEFELEIWDRNAPQLAMLGRLNKEIVQELADVLGDSMKWNSEQKNAEVAYALHFLRDRHGVTL